MSRSEKVRNTILITLLFSLVGCSQGAFKTEFGSAEEDFPGFAFQSPDREQKISLERQDIVSVGTIKPTVYYFPIINEDQTSCSSKVSLIGKSGENLASICQSTLAACSLQGSCAIVQRNKTRSFNIAGRAHGRDRFFEMTNSPCKYGFGVKNSCLDPFYSIAADLSIYKAGDVIYVPSAAGLRLPNGGKHNGYFIVRDTGRSIVGKGRFDFFSGYYSWRDPKNPFKSLGLGDKRTKLTFYKVSGETAQTVLEGRDFPKLPNSSKL
ncbi:3D domain-containing protein [Bdellovibrio sp. HCB337]|uniref:3D domain-containing protein n=1 Tax=Bdellovibrio sp. HCB337 TaxID=3394358 RepID=UPI0039A67070